MFLDLLMTQTTTCSWLILKVESHEYFDVPAHLYQGDACRAPLKGKFVNWDIEGTYQVIEL